MRKIRLVSRFASLTIVTAVTTLGWQVHGSEQPNASAPREAREFLATHCNECHTGGDAEGGFDLDTLGRDLGDEQDERRWVQIVDRIDAGEMPPKDVDAPEASEREQFLTATGQWLRAHQHARVAEIGRVRARRLTRTQVERSLHALLGIDIPLADHLPEEAKSSGFTTVADGQAMSHFQLQRHLAVVDLALDEAFRRALSPPDKYQRDFDARGVARRNPRRRCREPEMLNGQAVVWSGGVIFYGRLPATSAPEDGWYRFTVRISALNVPQNGGVWTTARTGLCVSSAPLLTLVDSFEATAEPKTVEFVAWLPKRHMLEIRPGDTTLKKARFAGGQIGTGEGEPQNVPGIAIDQVTMQRVHRDSRTMQFTAGKGDDYVRQLLFGDVEVASTSRSAYKVVPQKPRQQLEKLLVDFACRAYRRPVEASAIAGYVEQATAALDAGNDFTEALRLGYRALLCSPRFLYFTESPGQLDDHAVASRLSYLLTGGTPDAALRAIADRHGFVDDSEALQAQADRLLANGGVRRFVEDFAAEWLDLDQIDFTVPDRKRYPKFDTVVQHAMLNETHTFLETMVTENMSVARLMDADFTFLNSRLARFYDVEGVQGDTLRRVTLKPGDRRGGILTHGSILKVTANGSTTSPVVRGVWVSERLLGIPIPPPPGNVPAIEPDIRGATTIREQLAKHRSQDACASCHVKIDPPGFALENFDPAGQWRDRYQKVARGRRTKGATIDPSYTLPDGRKFAGIDEFRVLAASDPRRLAANVAEKLVVYATGAPISFADREAIEAIVDEAAKEDYGFRSIVDAVVASPIFLHK